MLAEDYIWNQRMLLELMCVDLGNAWLSYIEQKRNASPHRTALPSSSFSSSGLRSLRISSRAPTCIHQSYTHVSTFWSEDMTSSIKAMELLKRAARALLVASLG